MDPMHALDPRRCKPAADDKVDANRRDLACGIKIAAPHVPRFGNAESRFKQLVLHPRVFAPWPNAAQCRIQPVSIVWSCGRRQGFAARLPPPLTAPAG